ncbi:MAG TPA: sigma-54 dependent transcriptional regulator [Terriglobales bacterium]|nr:sigma-54 dependent transcriptional regulator [Terriglobales bacterium]
MSEAAEPAILVLDDERSSVDLLRITLGMDYPVFTATDGATALQLLHDHDEIALAIIDQRMPGMTGTEFIQRTIEPYPNLVRVILTGYTDTESLIQAINAGRVYRYLTKPWSKDELLLTVRQGLEVHRLAVDNLRLQDELRQANERLRVENVVLRREVKGRYRFDDIIGNSAALQRSLGLVERVIATDTTVLITGETGTGKELVARAIHYNGPRSDKPFININCTDFSPEILSSELFGHKRGSFTGAVEDRQGLFKAADGGTILLDEIGDCPETVQARLLRVLDQGEIRRVGDDRAQRIDVRVIAATNRNLELEVQSGRFRKDLFYRLNVFQIALPPLRQRRDDIVILSEHFLAKLCRSRGKHVPGFTAEAAALLQDHSFEGNVRELENLVERAFTLVEADAFITADLLPDSILAAAPPPIEAGTLRAAVDGYEARLLRDALERNCGNQTRTAQELGLSRRALIDKIQKYNLRDLKP